MASCPQCNHEGTPVVTRRVNTVGWILFAVLLFVFFPLCWLPLIVDACKEEVYQCENCTATIGSA